MAAVILLPQNAINNDVPVAADEFVTLAKLESVDVRNGGKKSYFIHFYVDTAHRKKIVWRYEDKTCRDADYTRVINELNSTTS